MLFSKELEYSEYYACIRMLSVGYYFCLTEGVKLVAYIYGNLKFVTGREIQLGTNLWKI